MDLGNLALDQDVKQEVVDSVGGGFTPWESGIYDVTVVHAYIDKSNGGAMSLNVRLSDGDREISQPIWITSGDKKGNKPYYIDKKDIKHPLPGYTLANDLCLLTFGKSISSIKTEEKVIKLYDYDLKSEAPKKVNMVMELIGQKVKAGILKQLVDKNVKDDNGNYVASGETREDNDISKFFRDKDSLTVVEITNKITDPVFYGVWKTKWEGKTNDKAKGKSTTGVKQIGQTKSPTPTKSLF